MNTKNTAVETDLHPCAQKTLTPEEFKALYPPLPDGEMLKIKAPAPYLRAESKG